MHSRQRGRPTSSIGVVIINWNGWRDTLRAYASLGLSTHTAWKAVIVDNASSDGSLEEITRGAPAAAVIPSTVNLGFAGGCNLGISECKRLGLDCVFLLNSDAMVRPDTLAKLVTASNALGGEAVLGTVVKYWPSGELQYFGSRKSDFTARPDWYRFPEDAHVLRKSLIGTDFIFGAALFAPMKLFEVVGPFDERFFLNFEETDWCYRASDIGVQSYVVADAVVDHAGSASLGDKAGPMQTYFLHRNRLLFYDKHASFRHRMRAYKEVARLLASRIGADRRFRTNFISIEPSTEALLLALRDYVLRRFGDCPQRVRTLAQKYRDAAKSRPPSSQASP